MIPPHLLTGTSGQSTSTLLIVAIATAVCSIPVISRIFWDLGMMRTRFVTLILGSALLEDLALWVVLAFATAIATSANLAQQHLASTVSSHVIGTLIYTLIGLFLAPGLLKRLSNASWNVLYKASPVGYTMAVLMTYCAIAAIFEVNLQFGALLAGYGIKPKNLSGLGLTIRTCASPTGRARRCSGVTRKILFAVGDHDLVAEHIHRVDRQPSSGGSAGSWITPRPTCPPKSANACSYSPSVGREHGSEPIPCAKFPAPSAMTRRGVFSLM